MFLLLILITIMSILSMNIIKNLTNIGYMSEMILTKVLFYMELIFVNKLLMRVFLTLFICYLSYLILTFIYIYINVFNVLM